MDIVQTLIVCQYLCKMYFLNTYYQRIVIINKTDGRLDV